MVAPSLWHLLALRKEPLYRVSRQLGELLRRGAIESEAEAARAYLDQGFVLLAVGADAVHLGNAAEASLARVRD